MRLHVRDSPACWCTSLFHLFILYPIDSLSLLPLSTYVLSCLDPQYLAMTTLIPREKYTADELSRLYPKELALQQVQVVRMGIYSIAR
jgi:hypothetical protein